MNKLNLEKTEEPEVKLPTFAGSSKKQEVNILAWEIPQTEDPFRLQSISKRVGHGLVTK